MRLRILILIILLFSEVVCATDIYSQCQQVKANLKAQSNADLMWSSYTVSNFTSLDKIRFDGFDIPIVVTGNMEESAFLFGENPELVFSSTEDNEQYKSQIVMLNSNLLKNLNTEQPSILKGNVFEALKKSLDISPDDIFCGKGKLAPEDLKSVEALAEKVALITLKSIVAPYGSTDAIQVKNKNAFIIRSKRGFEYYEFLNGKSLKVIVETNEATDLDQFIKTLELTSMYKEHSPVTATILKAIKSKKVKDWENALKAMRENSYTQSSQDSINEIVDYLTK